MTPASKRLRVPGSHFLLYFGFHPDILPVLAKKAAIAKMTVSKKKDTQNQTNLLMPSLKVRLPPMLPT